VRQLDTETADLDLTSQVTVLTDTPDTSVPTLCQGLIYLGGTKNLDGSGGYFEVSILVGDWTLQPDPQSVLFSSAVRATVFTSAFPVPADTVVTIKIKSPNAADTDVEVTSYLYEVSGLQPATLGRQLGVESDGHAHADVKEWVGNAVTRSDIGRDNTIYLAKDGNDSNDGLTRGQAVLTGAQAITNLSSGWNLDISPGTYDGAVDGSSLDNIRVLGNGAILTSAANTFVLGNGWRVYDLDVVTTDSACIAVWVNSKTDTRLYRMKISGKFDGLLASDCDGLIIDECILNATYDSANLTGTTGIAVRNSQFSTDGSYDAIDRALLLDSNSQGYFSNCLFSAMKTDAGDKLLSAISADSPGVVFEDCLFVAISTHADHSGDVEGVHNTSLSTTCINCTVYTSTAGAGMAYDLNADSGTIAFSGHYDDAKTNGTIADIAADIVAAELATYDGPTNTEMLAAHTATDALLALIKAKTNLITTANVTAASAVTTALDIELVQYDDYLDANSKALTWSNTSGDWFAGDLTDASVALTLTAAHDGKVMLTKAGSVVTATGTQEVSVELTAANTALFTKPGKQYKYQLLLTKATYRETEVTGDVKVTLTNNAPG